MKKRISVGEWKSEIIHQSYYKMDVKWPKTAVTEKGHVDGYAYKFQNGPISFVLLNWVILVNIIWNKSYMWYKIEHKALRHH